MSKLKFFEVIKQILRKPLWIRPAKEIAKYIHKTYARPTHVHTWMDVPLCITMPQYYPSYANRIQSSHKIFVSNFHAKDETKHKKQNKTKKIIEKKD